MRSHGPADIAVRVLGILFLALFAALPATNAAGQDDARPASSVCPDKSNADEAEQCLQSTLKHVQASLKQKYHDIEVLALAKKKGQVLIQLAQSQGEWEQHQHATCDALIQQATPDDPVSLEDAVSCKIELTLQRIRDLDRTFYVPLHH